jgi:hypothetical protein
MPAVIPMAVPPEADFVPCQYAADVTDGDPQEREYLYLITPDGRLCDVDPSGRSINICASTTRACRPFASGSITARIAAPSSNCR